MATHTFCYRSYSRRCGWDYMLGPSQLSRVLVRRCCVAGRDERADSSAYSWTSPSASCCGCCRDGSVKWAQSCMQRRVGEVGAKLQELARLMLPPLQKQQLLALRAPASFPDAAPESPFIGHTRSAADPAASQQRPARPHRPIQHYPACFCASPSPPGEKSWGRRRLNWQSERCVTALTASSGPMRWDSESFAGVQRRDKQCRHSASKERIEGHLKCGFLCR
jgi:hypothetical protein